MDIGSSNPTPTSENDTATPNTSTTTPNSSSHRGKADPAWAYVGYKKEGTQNVYTCICCGNIYRGGGINRMKQHLAGIPGQIASCKKVPHDVRHRMTESLKACLKKKSIPDIGDDEVEEEAMPDIGDVESGSKKRKGTGGLDNYFAKRTGHDSQPGIKSAMMTKEAKDSVKMIIAEWAIINCIPFSTFDCPLFQKAVDAIASIGPGFKAPSAYEFRVNLLSDWKKECQLLIEGHRKKWKDNGCTLMADGWTDVRQRTLINFLVYSTQGMVFVKSVDASDLIKDAKTLLGLFSEVIEWIGHKNVVHVVTDNAANYVACGRLIKEKYKSIYWSPCAAHCLNLVLKDICNMPHVNDLTSKASKITVFVYNHMIFLSWLRKRPGWKEIVRPGATRFATAFITLHSMYLHKQDLQALVIDNHFVNHKLSKTDAGIAFQEVVLDNRFWNNCLEIVKIVSPLVKLLRIVDSDEKPSLPYVYDGMRRAKNAIKEIFKRNKDKYKPYTQIIQARWDRHLKTDLHVAAYLLNPAFTYNEDSGHKKKLMKAMLDVCESESYSNELDCFKVMPQITLYRDGRDCFARESCKKAAQKLDPYEWWTYYGCSVPELQQLALRILSQASASSGCERNWSLFERIHTKRRNRLQHERLNDLVFTNYNLRLKYRSLLKKKATNFDPINYESIDKVDFWVVEDEEDRTPDYNDEEVAGLHGVINTENMDISNPQHLNDDATTASASQSESTLPNALTPSNLNELNDDDFGFYDY